MSNIDTNYWVISLDFDHQSEIPLWQTNSTVGYLKMGEDGASMLGRPSVALCLFIVFGRLLPNSHTWIWAPHLRSFLSSGGPFPDAQPRGLPSEPEGVIAVICVREVAAAVGVGAVVAAWSAFGRPWLLWRGVTGELDAVPHGAWWLLLTGLTCETLPCPTWARWTRRWIAWIIPPGRL